MDLMAARQQNGTSGWVPRVAAVICFGVACAFLANSLVKSGNQPNATTSKPTASLN
jgi:hypothetical protein